MYNHEPEDYDCPLCHIANNEPIKGESQESTVIYRTDLVTVFIAGRWWRAAPGHVIIIPNAHHENLYDLPTEIGHTIFDESQKVAKALKEVYGCDGTSTRQHNEPAGNQDAWHLHLHVYPRYKNDNLYIRQDETFWPSLQEKEPYAQKLRNYFLK
jgi:histidine triad (HIT) family protein